MPYIGKSPVGGGFHKLDNLTASATDTYALTLGSAAYYPETANQLLVSLNGVIQAPQDSFTVSGSNLVFDSALTASDSIDFVVALGDVLGVGSVTDGAVTTAKIGNGAVTSAKLDTNIAVSGNLDVGTIRDTSGTNTAITIDSSGRVTMANTTQIDMWRLTANFGTNTSTVTGWGQSNSAWEATVGASMAESSGIFTFPNTGLYKITGTFFMSLASGDISANLSLDVSSDSGSNYDTAAQAVESYGQNTSAALQTLINVTDASTFRVKLRTSGFNGGTVVAGNSTINISCLMFERITDAQ